MRGENDYRVIMIQTTTLREVWNKMYVGSVLETP